jgi:hypothetical protein
MLKDDKYGRTPAGGEKGHDMCQGFYVALIQLFTPWVLHKGFQLNNN